MHTLETAVVIPLIMLLLLGGIGLSVQSLRLIDRQAERYAREQTTLSSNGIEVLRITEVVYETLHDFRKS